MTKNQNCCFSDFLKKESSEFISPTFERKHFEVKFTNTSLYPNITNVLCMIFTFQHVVSSLSSSFREFIGDIFPLHTHTHSCTYTNTHINFRLLWTWTSSTSEYILFFIVAFTEHMEYRKVAHS